MKNTKRRKDTIIETQLCLFSLFPRKYFAVFLLLFVTMDFIGQCMTHYSDIIDFSAAPILVEVEREFEILAINSNKIKNKSPKSLIFDFIAIY